MEYLVRKPVIQKSSNPTIHAGLSKDLFSGRDGVADAGVDGGGLVDGAGESLEEGSGHVVAGASVEHLGVEVGGGVDGEGAQEFLDELEGESVDGLDVGGGAVFEERAAAEVDDGAAEGFIHGDVSAAVADEAAFFSEGLGEALSEDDAGIFDGVMEIDVDIALGGDLEIEEAVTGEEGEHVVEEGDAGGDFRLTGAVDGEIDGDISFGGLAGDGGLARVGHF